MTFRHSGVAVYTVDTTFTSRIASGLGVSRIPTVVGLYKERTYHFKGRISKDELKNFVNSFLPTDVITKVNARGSIPGIENHFHFVCYVQVASDNFQNFLAGMAKDDKPRVVLFSAKPNPALLYSLLTLKYQIYYCRSHPPCFQQIHV